MSGVVLVTGGAGYVGSRLVPELLDDGYQVRVLDWFLYQPRVFDCLQGDPRLTLVRGDIRDEALLQRCLDGAEAVIHLAAISNDPSCDLSPALTRSVNYDGARLVLRLAEAAGVQRFIFASSASVYGVKEGVRRVTEDLCLEPISLYAETKAAIEPLVIARNAPTFTTVIVRPATLCGYAPRQRLDLTVNILTHHAVVHRKITVFGGSQQRPNLTIQDMVRAYRLLLTVDPDQVGGEIFNIGAENNSVLEIAETVRSTIDREIPIDVAPTPDLRSYRLCSEKILQRLGFRPSHGIEDAVRELQWAFGDGRIADPGDDRYHNVRYMRKLSVM